MPERWTQLQERGCDAAAADEILGMSIEELGRATAAHWGLPRNLVAGMRHVEPGERGEGFGHADWLAALGTMSSQCADSLWEDDEAGADKVRELAASFAPMLGVGAGKILAAVEKARVEAAGDLTIAPLAKPAEKRAKAVAAVRERAVGTRILARGVAEMRDAAAEASPSQMVSMALETAYNGLSFTRAFAFLRNRRDGRYVARLGFGEGAKTLLPRLGFDDAYEPTVFHAALASDRVIFIENAHDAKFASKLPGWWKGSLAAARCFVIIPLSAQGQPAGFIYGDWTENAPPVHLSQAEFGLLNELRTQVVDAFERRHQLEAVAGKA